MYGVPPTGENRLSLLMQQFNETQCAMLIFRGRVHMQCERISVMEITHREIKWSQSVCVCGGGHVPAHNDMCTSVQKHTHLQEHTRNTYLHRQRSQTLIEQSISSYQASNPIMSRGLRSEGATQASWEKMSRNSVVLPTPLGSVHERERERVEKQRRREMKDG